VEIKDPNIVKIVQPHLISLLILNGCTLGKQADSSSKPKILIILRDDQSQLDLGAEKRIFTTGSVF
jgi:hypothetical protein